jgi:DNA-binding MarR family transcriptional regulator
MTTVTPESTSAPTPEKAAPTVATPETEAELAARLRLAVMRLSRRLRQQVADGATPSQVSALATVERLGSPTLGELATSEKVRPPSMTRIVVGLEEAGLVRRQIDADDRRVARVMLTADGRRVLQRSRSLRTAFLARRLKRLSAPERQALGELVGLLELLVEEA